MFRKAQRKSAKLRLALMGPAGAGKTYSALQIATGLGGGIAMIDTERGSGELYSHLADYDVAQINPPFTPEKYIDAIKAASVHGFTVLIIDSLSHAWAGEGGVLDIHDKVAKSVRNSFSAWREVTPMHNALVDAILNSPLHVIVTMRSKTAYEVINEGGKSKVAKIGLAPQQREGLEYEFTVVFDLSIDGHVASATKDRTGLFDGQYFTPSEETGRILLGWLESGAPQEMAVPEVKLPAPPDSEKPNAFLHSQLYKLLQENGLLEYHDAYVFYVCSRYGLGSMDDMSSRQLTEQVLMLRQCKDKREKLNQFVELLKQQKMAA